MNALRVRAVSLVRGNRLGRVPRAAGEPRGVDVVTLLRADGSVACARCQLAERPWTRLRGLLGRSGLDPEEGMLIRPAGSVHTAFMRFPIDIVFLDRELTVLSIRPAVPPWRAAAQRGAKATLELPAGAAGRVGLEVGETLTPGSGLPRSAAGTRKT